MGVILGFVGGKCAAELVVTMGLSRTSVTQALTSAKALGLVFRALVQLGQVFTEPEQDLPTELL